MGRKPSIKGKGLDVLLGSEQEDIKEAKQQDVNKAKNKNRKTAKQEKLIKRTFYITEKEDLLLEKIKLQRKERGEKVDKSELVREAIRLLAEREKL